jgi:hypothetical protein
MPLLTEVARQVLAEMELTFETLRSNLKLVTKYQQQVFERQLKVELESDDFISDRTLDNLAYTASHTLVLPELLPKALEHVELLRESKIFFIRPHKALMVDDGIREQSNWDEIMRIDGMIDFMYNMWGLNVVSIADLSLKDRVRTAMCFI